MYHDVLKDSKKSNLVKLFQITNEAYFGRLPLWYKIRVNNRRNRHRTARERNNCEKPNSLGYQYKKIATEQREAIFWQRLTVTTLRYPKNSLPTPRSRKIQRL